MGGKRKKAPPEAPLEEQFVVDVEFDREEAVRLAKKHNISEARWDRIHRDIDIRDVLERLYPERRMVSQKIRCPFHGEDRTPSFTVYPRTNTAYCFGCPDKDGFWDTVKIVSREMEISLKKAVIWLEKEWDLPPMEEDEEEETSTEEVVVLTVDDVTPSFIELIRSFTINNRREVEATTEEALEAIERFFRAHHEKDALPLARLLGSQRVKALCSAKIEASTQ